MLTCQRSHEGLKTTKPCPRAFELDLDTLVAMLGHTFEVDQLSLRLVCPGCGSHHHSLSCIAPMAPPAEPIPLQAEE